MVDINMCGFLGDVCACVRVIHETFLGTPRDVLVVIS